MFRLIAENEKGIIERNIEGKKEPETATATEIPDNGFSSIVRVPSKNKRRRKNKKAGLVGFFVKMTNFHQPPVYSFSSVHVYGCVHTHLNVYIYIYKPVAVA